MPQETRPDHQEPRDLVEAVDAFLGAKGRHCNVCTGESPARDGHDVNPPCEQHALEVLRQRYAETRAVPGMSEGVALAGITERTFDDVARAAEADAQRVGGAAGALVRLARFVDLDDESQTRLVSGVRGVFAQMATIARNRAPQ